MRITDVYAQAGTNVCVFFTSRNPDNDAGPWCHILKNHQLTWELCDVPKCCEWPLIFPSIVIPVVVCCVLMVTMILTIHILPLYLFLSLLF